MEWIPGYWQWSDEVENFVWVSGLWRNIPPGRQWVPGYWHETGGRFEWVSGFWSDAQQAEVRYLPEPPESLERPGEPFSRQQLLLDSRLLDLSQYRVCLATWLLACGPNKLGMGPVTLSMDAGRCRFRNGVLGFPAAVSRIALRSRLLDSAQLSGCWLLLPATFRDRYGVLLRVLYVHRDYGRYYYGYGGWAITTFTSLGTLLEIILAGTIRFPHINLGIVGVGIGIARMSPTLSVTNSAIKISTSNEVAALVVVTPSMI